MKYEFYTGFIANSDHSKFEFVSEGRNGAIRKRITFISTQWPNVYNLAFGDITEDDDIDDYKISNNGDRNKILVTVLKIVQAYTEKYPDRWIYFKGSTDHRTRLYRIAITLHLEELSSMFEIFGEINGQEEFICFQKGLNISAFLIKRKIIKFVL